jgi:AMMECR1 domain-containing protein
VALARPLSREQRRRIRSHVSDLLEWQTTLARWPAPAWGPDAMPFVTLYAAGVLRGCFGCAEGPPNERLTRAFLRALEDSRYGLVRAGERRDLAAVVSYPVAPRPVDPDRVAAEVEAGAEGLGAIADGCLQAMLLPHSAHDLQAGPREFLSHLARKAGSNDWTRTTVIAFRTQDVVVRRGEPGPRADAAAPKARAAAWLDRLVARDGAVAFAVDARRRHRSASGPMHHGRAAVALRALRTQASHERSARRAARWLDGEIRRALGGHAVEAWPDDPAMRAGTLALAVMAGLDFTRELAAICNEGLSVSPWYAAQAVTALGDLAPEPLWSACVRDLENRPWAPWTLLAASARHDAEVMRRTSQVLMASLRDEPPHRGGCSTTEVPETALTALVVEALSGIDDPQARAAVGRGRRFLRRLQLVGERIPAALEPGLAEGAFPASPVVDLGRCDVVGHALLALGP